MKKVQCQRCHQKFTVTPGEQPTCPSCGLAVPLPEPQAPEERRPPVRTYGQFRHIICPNPNCGYEGPATRTPKGSLVAFAVLVLLGLLPGLLYLFLTSGCRYTCPKCGIQIGETG